MENPYGLSLTAPSLPYLARIGIFSAGFALINVSFAKSVAGADAGGAMEALSSPRQGKSAGKNARSGLTAATTVCSLLHSFVTSAAAVWVVFALALGGDKDLAISIWQWALAFSQGYFVVDALVYGTQRESWVLVHHSWMVIAHHPIGEPTRLCSLMGAGDCSVAVWLSATGYFAEISTVFLCLRFFQIKWMTEHNIWYTINSACLLATYPTMRVGGAIAILVGSLWPRWEEYSRNGLGSLVVFTTVTYVAMAAMSSFYTFVLLRKGVRHALMFSPASKEQ